MNLVSDAKWCLLSLLLAGVFFFFFCFSYSLALPVRALFRSDAEEKIQGRLRRKVKVKVIPQHPGRSRPRIFLTFGTTRVVGRQPYAPAAFTPAEIPGTYLSV
jgi:uncharacterized protein (DUF58 family)